MNIEADWDRIFSLLEENRELTAPISFNEYNEIASRILPLLIQLIKTEGEDDHIFLFDCGMGTSPSADVIAEYLLKSSILGTEKLDQLIDEIKKKEGNYELSLQATMGAIIESKTINSNTRLLPIKSMKDFNILKSTIYEHPTIIMEAQTNTLLQKVVKGRWKICPKTKQFELSIPHDKVINPLKITFASLLLSYDTPQGLRFDTPTTMLHGWAEGASSAITTAARSQTSLVSISENQISSLNIWASELLKIEENDFNKLWIALTRICSSCVISHPVDQLIELRIALEATYTNNKENIRSSMSNRLAKLNAETIEDRISLSKKAKLVYDVCSTAVHAGEMDKKYNFECIREIRQIAFENIKYFASHRLPNWTSFDLEG